MAKTVNQILKGALFDILRNTKGAYSATISVEMLSNKPISSLSREVTVDLSSKGDEYKEPGDERSGRLVEAEAE